MVQVDVSSGKQVAARVSSPLKNGLRAKHDVSLKQAIAKIACLGGPAAACCRVADVENGQDGLFQRAAKMIRQSTQTPMIATTFASLEPN